MSAKTYLITGANRGIGFALVKQLSAESKNTIIATARKPEDAAELNEWSAKHPNVKILKLDVISSESVQAAAEEAAKILPEGLDVLVSNAGFLKNIGPFLDCPDELYIEQFNVNTVGPIRLVRAFKSLLDKKESKEVAIVTSVVGSLNIDLPMPFSGYGVSKAAINYAIKGLSQDLSPVGYSFVAIHPGLVGSDMGDYSLTEMGNHVAGEMKKALPYLTPDESATAINQNVLKNLKAKNAGKFLSYDGSELPW
ncbi:LAME_0H17084g1_1 [Lachancea meyersii CBS 8951]|uniref:LAME_0H17084g1_1 n=1 Tax=Lachancea meyersii CBS 8951 TaxID=1266667 RepID=A0A1G4KIM8_9SACH|nr:LAME_0H17084g1_1 [Lachancea meyersii CBS 8951]